MDRHGMLPQANCNRCGKPLNEHGRRPAELYAGTFNGLCYACTMEPPYVVRTLRDGCRIMSCPPTSPSWRRDRTEHHGYEDCENCKGNGYTIIQRSDAKGGNYSSYCEPCLRRFAQDDLRNQAWKAREELEDETTAYYIRLLKDCRIYTKAKKNQAPQRLIDECREVARTFRQERLEVLKTAEAEWNVF